MSSIWFNFKITKLESISNSLLPFPGLIVGYITSSFLCQSKDEAKPDPDLGQLQPVSAIENNKSDTWIKGKLLRSQCSPQRQALSKGYQPN